MPKHDIPKAYEAKQYEDDIYTAWENSGFFNPDNLSGEPFSLMMPPPNVTGVLHLGHALENTIMDSMIRYQRMRGRKALLLPGTDHAAVATQSRVEKNLVKEGIEDPRQEYGREKMLEIIREYAEESKTTILSQICKMGTSADWSRLAYTFDDERSKAVNEVFVRMYKDGLIYRGTRMVNWSVGAHSVLSDDELEWEDRKEPFYYIRCGSFVIGTVRPETKCADSPLVVHPTGTYVRLSFDSHDGGRDSLWVSENLYNDPAQRATVFNLLDTQDDFTVEEKKNGSELEGETFEYDTYAGRRTFTIIADEVIDIKKGAGAMTISSNHSADDYDLANRRELKSTFITKIDFDGRMTEIAGPCSGMTILEARKRSVELMKEQGLLVGEDISYEHRVPICYRSGVVVEPMVSTQWFVAVNKQIPGRGKTLKQLMKEAVATGHNGDAAQKIEIKPDRFENSYYQWIDHLRDWCISRQIWWGHRIPVWYCKEGKDGVCKKGCEPRVVVGRPDPCPGCGTTDLEQDPDTLDTWFSSGLWTFSTLGWPNETVDLKTFHPTSWMQMGYEILFFWMARMILMSTYVLDEIPFKEVYIHGMLRDKDGQKFSKSLGNGIDPIEVIEKYSADALRFSLITGVSPGNDSRFYEEKVEAAQRLVNKLWNVSRYILTSVDEPAHSKAFKELKPKTLADRWILSKLVRLEEDVSAHFQATEFSQASEKLREFTWSDFADWYLEMTKAQRQDPSMKASTDDILVYVLEHLLTYWHPIMPFVTEQIWTYLGDHELLMAHNWPVLRMVDLDLVAEQEMDQLQSVITAVRTIRSQYNVAPKQKVQSVIVGGSFQDQTALIEALAGVESLAFESSAPSDEYASTVVGDVQVFVSLEGLVDEQAEQAKLENQREQTAAYIKTLEQKLANGIFTSKAPEHVVATIRQNLETAKKKHQTIEEHLALLGL
jgi:valyl-tRNA synthetase